MRGCPKTNAGRFALIMSGFLRQKYGWVDPIEIDSTVTNADTTIVLKNAATEGSDGFAVVRTANEEQFFLLECRDADSSPYLVGEDTGDCPVEDNFSGLLVSHIAVLNPWNRGWHECTHDALTPWAAPGVDFELATAMFDSSTWEIDPVHGFDAMGFDRSAGVAEDLFQPAAGVPRMTNAFTPYTNPSTNLYPDSTYYFIPNWYTKAIGRQDVYSGISIYNIEWANAGHDSMRVSIRFDGSVPPESAGADTIRVDTTWDGRMQLSNGVVVAPGVELTIEEGSQVIAKASDTSDKVTLETRGTSTVNGSVSDPSSFSPRAIRRSITTSDPARTAKRPLPATGAGSNSTSRERTSPATDIWNPSNR